jgi:hypothetical protein
MCLATLLGVGLTTPIEALADNAALLASSSTVTPSCDDAIQPRAAENPKVSIVLDPNTAWQPRGGTVSFTVSGNNVTLEGVKVIACFGWPGDDWKATKKEAQVSLAKFDTDSATYNVVVPALDWSHVSWANRTALWTVPLATMRIMAHGGVATPTVDVQSSIGITSPLLALLLAVLAVAIAFGVFFVFGRARGVPGKDLVLWMISTRNGVASLSQAQIVLWTFLVGAAAVYVMALSGVLIDITDSALVLLGIAGIATVGAKLQSSQQDAQGTSQADGKTALPGKVLNLLQVGPATDSEVRLAWAPPTTGGPVTHYLVQYQPTPPAGGPANPVWSAVGETIVQPYCTVLGLAPATSYQFEVRAVSAGGSSDPEEIGPIQTQVQAPLAAGAPHQTGGLRVASAPTLTGVELAWSPADGGPTGYAVQHRRHGTVEAWTTVLKPTTESEFTVEGLDSGIVYDFRVAATNTTGQGSWSAVVTARTLREPQWADLVVTGDGPGQIDVTRAQMLFFTVVAALFVGMKVLTSYVIPEIPQGILLLMGISNGVYMTAKFIPD